nr:immunoglobulin light chain junction region [Macaca mulatta]
CQMYSRFPWTF